MLAPLPDGVSVSVMLLRRLPCLSIVDNAPRGMNVRERHLLGDAVRLLAGDRGIPARRCVVDIDRPESQDVDRATLAAHILAGIRAAEVAL